MTRQQLRAQLRADALVRVNSTYGPEPRRARRKIARAWAKTEWRKRAALAVSCGILALTSLGFLATSARAQGSRKDDVVFNAQGRPMAGATVRVCTAAATGQPCSPLANIYSDAALTQAMANPLTTDGLGNYTFYAAPGLYEIEISGPNITTKQMPNVILPNDPSTPTFTSLATTSGITAFSLTLSGNLTVNGSTAVTGTLTEGGAPVATTTPTFVTTNAESSLPNSRQLVAGTNTTVDTSVPGQIAIDAGGGAASFSVSSYGARSLSLNASVSTTATCVSSSASVTLGGASIFQNADGIDLFGCGAATSLTTPSAPTVAPYALSGPENSGQFVPLTGQSTTYCYEIAGEDQGNGHTAASSQACTTSGDATLGLHTATISSCSLSGIIVTCTLTTSPTDLPDGAYIHVIGANPAQFDGFFTIYSISGSTVEWENPQNSNFAGVVTSATGGTLTWKVANLLTWSSDGSLDHIVYGRTSSSLGYMCVSALDNRQGGYQQDWFADYGSTESANCARPAWIPATTPASAQNDALVTTILSGGGTTSLVVATAASASTAAATAQFDNCAQFQAAANAAIAGGGVLYFPPGVWINSSYCALPAGITINQAGAIQAYNTIDISNTPRWYSNSYSSGTLGAASFGLGGSGAAFVTINSPYPTIYANGDRSGNHGGIFDGLVILSEVNDEATGLLIDDQTGWTIDHSYISSGEGGYDYLGSTLVVRASSGGGGNFDSSISNSSFIDAMTQYPIDESWAPTILMLGNVGDTQLLRVNTNTRGGIGYYGGNQLQATISQLHAQGPDIPIVQTNASLNLNFFNVGLDSSAATALVACNPRTYGNGGATVCGGYVYMLNSYQPSQDTYGYPGAITGVPISSLATFGTQNNLGQNSGVVTQSYAANIVNGFSAVRATPAVANAPGGPTVVPHGTFAPFAFQPQYPSISASVGSGGSVPAGTYLYQYEPIFPSGGHGVLSPAATVTVTSGNQTVTASIASAVAGAVGYAWYRTNTNGSTGLLAVSGCWDVGTSCTDASASSLYPNGGAYASADGYPHFGTDGLITPQVTTGALTGALTTKSSAYTLTSSDYWVNVTGTTAITVPHAIVGQHWVVFNSGSNTVTVEADSGNINGAASITLSANTGREIACDGTNCFAH